MRCVGGEPPLWSACFVAKLSEEAECVFGRAYPGLEGGVLKARTILHLDSSRMQAQVDQWIHFSLRELDAPLLSWYLPLLRIWRHDKGVRLLCCIVFVIAC